MSDQPETAAAEVAAWVPAGITLVGRDQELERLDAVLQRRRPAVVIVSAEAGIGKTTLLRAAALRAAEGGWATTHSEGEGELEVTQTTAYQDFSDRLSARLGISPDEPGLETPSAPEPLPAMAAPLSQRAAGKPFDPLVRRLHQHSPVLLLIDGFRPSARFSRWFHSVFVAQVAKTGAPIVVIIADRPREVEALEAAADLVLQLQPPDAAAVRRHFQALGERLAPPMGKTELEVYVQATRQKPEILDTLTRLLRLIQTAE